MDPNATLAEMREIAAGLEDADSDDLSESEIQALLYLAGQVRAMDDWLSKGGFLPTAWKLAR
jgi:hypothetical protein